MTAIHTGYFGIDVPIDAAALPTTNTALSWYNVQRRRLAKFAKQFRIQGPVSVPQLRSQGEPDVTIPEVVDSRNGFTQLRRDLPVLDQYFEYSGDIAYLKKVKDIALAWARVNIPDGKPINETNFEWLVRVLHRRQGDLSAAELVDADAWVQSLREAKESAAAGNFQQQMVDGEGSTAHGNWWTHHYKVLLLALHYQGDAAAKAALFADMDDFAARNFPFGNALITYPFSGAVLSANQAGGYFDVAGNHTAIFAPGVVFTVTGNSQGNDGTYTTASSSYLGGSARTRIITTQMPLAGSGGGGILAEPFDPARHDMPRAATAAGESIDYIRRDALHYQVYDVMPWLEIAMVEGGSRYAAVVESGWAFFMARLLSPTRHYEFAASSDSFDGLRWNKSHPEYLAPQAMFKPQRGAGLYLSYMYWRRLRQPMAYLENDLHVALACRAIPEIASFWPHYFRWSLGYGANA